MGKLGKLGEGFKRGWVAYKWKFREMGVGL